MAHCCWQQLVVQSLTFTASRCVSSAVKGAPAQTANEHWQSWRVGDRTLVPGTYLGSLAVLHHVATIATIAAHTCAQLHKICHPDEGKLTSREPNPEKKESFVMPHCS